MNDRLLKIYLNDHLAGSMAGLELVKRAHGSNPVGALGEFLARLERELQEDRAFLEEVVDALELGREPYKVIAAWVAEKLGRFKLNGQILGYSDLSRLVELESLKIGITGKLSMWTALQHMKGHETRLAVLDFDRMIKRAEEQLAELDRFLLQAATQAFGN